MDPIGAANIGDVLDAYRIERSALVDLLGELDADRWNLPTECPAYSVQGIAAHVLGDDLSLLSRQRDGALPGLILIAEKMPGSDVRALLDGFNDQWVEAARFMGHRTLIDLLRLSGEWTEAFYRDVDPMGPCEPVPLYSPQPGEVSPFWQAIAREYLERWTHHSQIRRALGRSSLSDAPFLETGVRIIAGVAGVQPSGGSDASAVWSIGSIVLGDRVQAADLLTLRHTSAEADELLSGPAEAVAAFAERIGRRPS